MGFNSGFKGLKIKNNTVLQKCVHVYQISSEGPVEMHIRCKYELLKNL